MYNTIYYTTKQIKGQISILDIADEFGLKVRKAGRSYKAFCPFHHEKTPSFFINPQKNIFKCFGCGEGGDLIYLYSLFKEIDNGQAYSELAKRLGLSRKKKLTKEEKKAVIKASQSYEDKKLEKKFYEKCKWLFYSLCEIRDTISAKAKAHSEMEDLERDSELVRLYHEKTYLEYLLDGLLGGVLEEIEIEEQIHYYKEAKGVVERWKK